MNRTMRTSVFIFPATFFIVAIILASSAYAACNPTVKPGESIQDAIDAITSTPAEICIGAGTYEEDIVLKTGITLRGEELARTIIDAGGSGAVVTAASNTTVWNMSLKNGSSGILLDSQDSNVTVKNVIITDTTTAIDCAGCGITIDHTVIDTNTTGIDMKTQLNLPAITLQNSMLVNNDTDVRSDQTTVVFDTTSHNLLFNNTNENYPDDSISDPTSVFGKDPLFVGRASNDYHVKVNSPAIDAGTGSNDPDGSIADIGAYGGPDMDTKPVPVENIMAATVTGSTSELDVTWNINEAYNITRYKVYFDFDLPGEPYANSVNVGNVDATRLTNLDIVEITGPPSGLTTRPGDGKLSVSWNGISTASKYTVYYGTDPNNLVNTIDAGLNTAIIIGNLINGTDYYIAVSASFETVYYVSVAAIDTEDNESALVNEDSVILVPLTEGPRTVPPVSDFPEESIPFPILKDENRCFIATAAFGSPLEPHVKLLRTFRDRYLLTNGAGRQLVSWYYSASPPIADFIWSHEWLRAIVRTALFPVVWAVSFYMKPYGPLLSVMLLFIIAALSLHLFRRRKLS